MVRPAGLFCGRVVVTLPGLFCGGWKSARAFHASHAAHTRPQTKKPGVGTEKLFQTRTAPHTAFENRYQFPFCKRHAPETPHLH